MAQAETITLGGGCFWCLEAVYSEMQGVLSVESGYMGGHVPNPTYRDVCTGDTGHVEVVQVRFDPAVTSVREILEVFFAIHDPTSRDRQGNDAGPQYRSAIFYHDDRQQAEAKWIICELEREGGFDKPIVTEVRPASTFHRAED
jgi:peptide-methionine (S)-S-oxide reductase